LDGGRQIVANRLAAGVEGEAFAGVERGAVRGGQAETLHLGLGGDHAFPIEAFGFGRVFEGERRHPCLPESANPENSLTGLQCQNLQVHPADLVQRTFVQEGVTFVAEAPLCPRKRAIGQFDAAVPYFEELFFGYGPLDEYATLFRMALDPLPYRYLTIELDEISRMAPSRQEFRDTLRGALAGIGRDESTEGQARFIYLAQLWDLHSRFPPPRLKLDEIKGSDNDYVLHGRILGACDEGRKVPWE